MSEVQTVETISGPYRQQEGDKKKNCALCGDRIKEGEDYYVAPQQENFPPHFYQKSCLEQSYRK